jgi:hypothetical protein
MAGVLAGCATIQTTYTPLENQAVTPKMPEDVKVFSTSNPNIPYDEIGIIEVEGHRRDSSAALILALRAKAAENGADGVIVQEMTERNRGFVPVGNMLLAVQRKSIRGTTIRFKK